VDSVSFGVQVMPWWAGPLILVCHQIKNKTEVVNGERDRKKGVDKERIRGRN